MLSRCCRFMPFVFAILIASDVIPASAQNAFGRDGARPSGGRPIGGFGGGALIGAGLGLGGVLLNGTRRAPPSDQPPPGRPPPRYRPPRYVKVRDPRPQPPRHPRPVKQTPVIQTPVIVARKHPPRQRPVVQAARARPSFPIPAADERRYVPNEILISIRDQVPPARLRQMEATHGLTPLAAARITLLGLDVRRYRLRSGANVPQTIRALSGAPRFVAAVQPNFLFDLQDDAPSAPAGTLEQKPIPAALPIPNVDIKPVAVEPQRPPQYAVAALKLDAAHKIATGADVLIAVIDTGMDETHPDIAGMVADRFDAVGGVFVPLSHGTAMAGVIVAHKDLVGIAPGARLLAIRAFTSLSNGGANGTGFDILRGLDFAATHGARIVNMSFAGPEDALLHEALDVARTRGMIEIAAAGNAGPGSKPLFPAAQPGVIAVTATDSDNKLFAMANRGAYVAVAAPGVNILAPAIKGAVQLTSGTSVATAEVSGVAALLVQGHAKASADDVRRLLRDTAQHLPLDPALAGAGLVDAFAAVSAAR